MNSLRRLAAIGALSALIVVSMGWSARPAQARGHVYLLFGLVRSLSYGMDEIGGQLRRRGIKASVYHFSAWQSVAAEAAAAYRAGEGPIILMGHSLGVDAAIDVANYLAEKGIPVALVVAFDSTRSFAAPRNVARLLNFTQWGSFATKGPRLSRHAQQCRRELHPRHHPHQNRQDPEASRPGDRGGAWRGRRRRTRPVPQPMIPIRRTCRERQRPPGRVWRLRHNTEKSSVAAKLVRQMIKEQTAAQRWSVDLIVMELAFRNLPPQSK